MSVSDERFAHTAHSHRRPHTLALIVALYRKRQSAHVEDLTSLKL